MSALTRPHVEIDGARELLNDIATNHANHKPDAAERDRMGRRLLAAAATMDLGPARAESARLGYSVVLGVHELGPALAARWFAPGVPTPIHGHGTWGVAAVIEGHQRYERWEPTEPGRAHLADERELTAGHVAHWGAPPDDLHRQEAVHASAFELIVLGAAPSKEDVDPYQPDSALEQAADAIRAYDIDALAELYRADALLDANVPHWRFQLQGPDAIRDALTEAVAELEDRRVTATRVTRSSVGVTVEVEGRFNHAGRDGLWREVHLLRGDDSGIGEHTIYCTGTWDPATIARHAVEAPMVQRP